ncbi:hypothetical protein [Kitasatospora mediocidica]|uniref:hypothetical protein n=1 Tax=Kitasatospora mediocidica TaxID=58352 RepID=UPI000569D152|nr:hypothetical protein [Kitasatospora mediocidica]
MRAVIALILLTIAWPALTGVAIGTSAYLTTHLAATLTIAAAVLLARHKPHRSHPVITFLIGASIATWITGHHGQTTQAPASGPQIPA